MSNLPQTLGELRRSQQFSEAASAQPAREGRDARQSHGRACVRAGPSSPASSATTTRSSRRSSTRSCRGTISFFWDCADRRRAASCAPSPVCSIRTLPYLRGCEIHDNPYAPICRRCRELLAQQSRRGADRVSHAGRALRREAGDARRHHRRPDRRHRSHQGGQGRSRTGQRVHRALRVAAARQSRHLRHQ